MNAATRALCLTCLVASAWQASAAFADDKTDYQKRVATRFLTLFQELDRDRDGRVTRAEVGGNLNFLEYFADMDTDRDNAVTAEELRRFLLLRLDVEVAQAPAPAR